MSKGAFSGSRRHSSRRQFQQISKLGMFGAAGFGTKRAPSRRNSSSTPTTTVRTREVFLDMREAPACYTHRTSPFGPQQRRSNSSTRGDPRQ